MLNGENQPTFWGQTALSLDEFADHPKCRLGVELMVDIQSRYYGQHIIIYVDFLVVDVRRNIVELQSFLLYVVAFG